MQDPVIQDDGRRKSQTGSWTGGIRRGVRDVDMDGHVHATWMDGYMDMDMDMLRGHGHGHGRTHARMCICMGGG